MNADAILSALDLPTSSRVHQRVPKKLLLDNGAPTAADKRTINDGIEELLWLAALKPTTIGVPEYRDEVREYLEIAVLRLTLRATGKATRLMELIHRAVPYPVFLLTSQGERLALSLAHKRWAQNEVGKVVLDGGVVTVSLPDAATTANAVSAFTQALSLTRQPQTTLFGLYLGWVDTVHALLAARLTGTFKTADSPEHAAARRHALQECERLEFEAVRLHSLAAKENQLSRHVELNLALKRIQAQLITARQHL